MARRGDQLREHILWTAKDVFLELGFERTSMDVVAARAETSKRSLYAHYESKERLFLAVIEFVRGLFLRRLQVPDDYPGPPEEALVLFCAQYLRVLLTESSVQMIRLSIAETARFPAGASQYFDIVFAEVEARLGAYMRMAFDVPAAVSGAMAQRLLGLVFYPRLPRALFGLDALATSYEQDASSPGVDLAPIREAVAEVVARIGAARNLLA